MKNFLVAWHDVSVEYNGGFLPDIILLTQCYYHRGSHFKCCGRGFVFVAHEATMLVYTAYVVDSPYGRVVKRNKYISLHQLQYFNVVCVLDCKLLLYEGRWQYYY